MTTTNQTNKSPVMPVGMRFAVERDQPTVLEQKQTENGDPRPDSADLATFITDPSKKEWDD